MSGSVGRWTCPPPGQQLEPVGAAGATLGRVDECVVTTGTSDLTTEQRTSLVSLLQNPTYEVIPLKNAMVAATHLPERSTVSVTASPSKGMAATMALAAELAGRGFRVIPHLSARLTESHVELEKVIDASNDAGITEAFVVGGDAAVAGPFPDGLSLLEAMADLGHPFTRIGIPGYPEGHPDIPDDSLDQALENKAPYAAWVTTQMCFSDRAVATWVRDQRRRGIDLPVVIGLPGVAEVRKLLSIATRIGVGDSARFLSSHSGLGKLVRPGGYAPDELLTALAPLYTEPGAGIAGLHVYTFNQVETTERWRKTFLQELEA